MASSTHTIVSGYELSQLRRAQRWWWLGWAVAAIALLVAVFFAASARQAKAAYESLAGLQRALSQQQVTNAAVVTRLEEAWKHNLAIANTLRDYNDYVHERQSIVSYNKKMAPVALNTGK